MQINSNDTVLVLSNNSNTIQAVSTTGKIMKAGNITFRICTIENAPFVSRIKKSGPFTIDNMSGFVVKLVRYLSMQMEFIPYFYIPVDKQYGAKVGNNTIFSGCVGDVQQNKAEMAATVFTFTLSRGTVIDYTYPILEDPLALIYQIPPPSSKWFNVLNTLDYRVWLMLLASIAGIAFVTTFICRLSPFSAWNLDLQFKIEDEIKFTENVWTAIGTFLLQGQDFVTFAMSARCALAFWWMFAAIILAVYSAYLVTLITLDLGNDLPNTLLAFANQDRIQLYVVVGSSAQILIQTSSNPVIQKLNQKSNIVASCNAMLLNPAINNAACITDYSYVRYLVEKNCSRYAYIPEFIESGIDGFVIPKHSIYKRSIDYEIQTLTTLGIIQKWFLEDVINPSNVVCDNGLVSPDPIGLESSLGIFLIIFAMYVSGFILLIIEIVIKMISKRRESK